MNSQPEELHRQFSEAYNAGDLLRLLALYEPEARLALQSGELRIGHDAIRGALQRFLGMRGTFKLETVSVVEAGEIALLRGNWRLNGTGPDGSPVEMQGNSAEVARRQRDGRWLFVIDQP